MLDQPPRNLGKSAIAPDTSDWNFFDVDPALQDLLTLYLAPDLLAHLEPHLKRMGGMVAGELDRAAHLADRHPPTLHHRDRFGRDHQSIEYHPAYRELEEAAFGTFAMHAMSHRGDVLGWPSPFPAVAKHAFTYLFNQAEFGLGCPINVTDSAAHVLRLYASDAVKERFLPHMLSDDTTVLWQGAQFMTEREGGSDVGNGDGGRLEDVGRPGRGPGGEVETGRPDRSDLAGLERGEAGRPGIGVGDR